MRPAGEPSRSEIRQSGDGLSAELEQRLHYDRMGEDSTPAFLGVYRDQVAEEFFDWLRENPTYGQAMAEALRRFERHRFGGDLWKVPHGMLWFAVRIRLRVSDGGRPLPPVYYRTAIKPGEPKLSTPERAAREHEMPKARPTVRAYQQRLDELAEQKRKISDGEAIE